MESFVECFVLCSCVLFLVNGDGVRDFLKSIVCLCC